MKIAPTMRAEDFYEFCAIYAPRKLHKGKVFETMLISMKRLLEIGVAIVVISLVAGAVEGGWNLIYYVEPVNATTVTPPSQSPTSPPLSFWLVIAAWNLLELLVYPVLLVFSVYYLAKAMKESRRKVLVVVATTSLVGAVLRFVAERAVSGTLFQAPPAQLQSWFWFFLVYRIGSSTLITFLLALGAIALPSWVRRESARIGEGVEEVQDHIVPPLDCARS